jgi:uncharacterized protein (TIGR02271 family)
MAADEIGDGAVEVVRHEERLAVGTTRHAVGRVRVAKRVVTEERTVTVTVRREELVVEEQPLPSGTALDEAKGFADRGGTPVLELVLWEEEVRTEVVAVPRERVRVYVDRVESSTQVTEELAREVVQVDRIGSAGPRTDG